MTSDRSSGWVLEGYGKPQVELNPARISIETVESRRVTKCIRSEKHRRDWLLSNAITNIDRTPSQRVSQPNSRRTAHVQRRRSTHDEGEKTASARSLDNKSDRPRVSEEVRR